MLRSWLRPDERIAVLEAPGEGLGYVSVSAGWSYTCGLLGNGEAECWNVGETKGKDEVNSMLSHTLGGGFNGQALQDAWDDSPAAAEPRGGGPFTAVQAGFEYACGIRPGGAVECWGGGFNKMLEHTEKASPPAGTFESITNGKSGGAIHLCGLRPGGEAACWGDYTPTEERPAHYTPPPGEFTFISQTDGVYTCGIRPGGETECWGQSRSWPEAAPAPELKFTAVRLFLDWVCGVSEEAQQICWHITDSSELIRSETKNVKDITHARWHACNHLIDGAVYCYFAPSYGVDEQGNKVLEHGNVFGEASPPPGAFEEVAAGVVFTCGLRAEGRVECWGRDNQGQSSPPGGDFTDISVTADYACGLRADGGVTCWGARQSLSKAVAPNDELASVSAGWGDTNKGAKQATSGYTATSGSPAGCGQTTPSNAGATHTTVRTPCWRTPPLKVNSPRSRSGRRSPAACRPTASPSAGEGTTCSKRKPTWATSHTGKAAPPAGRSKTSPQANYTPAASARKAK